MGGVSSSTANPIDSNKSDVLPSSSIPGNSENDIPSTTSSNLPMSSSYSSVATETPEASDQSKKSTDVNGDEGQQEEDEGECGFCMYMKGGGCKDAFIAWENCIKGAEDSKEDVVEKCHEVTRSLTKCMDSHADYYEPILRAEKAAKDEAVNELEKEKAVKESESNVAEKEVVIVVDLTDWEAKKGSGDHKRTTD